jgi:hypothetical protein
MGEVRFTAAEAAPILGVTPAAVRTWVRRKKLTAKGKRGLADVFDWDDLLTCERDTRMSGRLPFARRVPQTSD